MSAFSLQHVGWISLIGEAGEALRRDKSPLCMFCQCFAPLQVVVDCSVITTAIPFDARQADFIISGSSSWACGRIKGWDKRPGCYDTNIRTMIVVKASLWDKKLSFAPNTVVPRLTASS